MDEELVVKKVKRRPAVLILREGADPRRMATHFSGSGAKPNPNSHVFAPIVSLQSHGENAVEETDLALYAVYLGAALETFWQDLEGQLLA